jgi:hypothetical protein
MATIGDGRIDPYGIPSLEIIFQCNQNITEVRKFELHVKKKPPAQKTSGLYKSNGYAVL